MGPYCNFCARRCFVLRVLQDGRSMLLATCARGMEHDRSQVGEDHTTALNPVTDQVAAVSRAIVTTLNDPYEEANRRAWANITRPVEMR